MFSVFSLYQLVTGRVEVLINIIHLCFTSMVKSIFWCGGGYHIQGCTHEAHGGVVTYIIGLLVVCQDYVGALEQLFLTPSWSSTQEASICSCWNVCGDLIWYWYLECRTSAGVPLLLRLATARGRQVLELQYGSSFDSAASANTTICCFSDCQRGSGQKTDMLYYLGL